MKTKIGLRRVHFHTEEYQFAHGRHPRGRGGWAFHPDSSVDSLDPTIIWVNGTYVEACKQAAKIARERGWDHLVVLS